MEPVPFENRWRIRGVLTAQSFVHVGAGEETEHPDLEIKDENNDSRRIKIAAVVRDHRGLPYLPGSTLKGAIRAWLGQHGAKTELISAVFGNQEHGGKAEFHDALQKAKIAPSHPPPYWHSDRQTSVDVSVKIDRFTGAAEAKKLFYQEFAPPGVEFELSITAQNLDDDEAALLLAGLKGFNATDAGINLGGDSSGGYGRLGWTIGDIARLGHEELRSWLQNPERPPWENALRPLTDEQQSALTQQAFVLLDSQAEKPLHIPVKIYFLSPFLVNDPSRVDKKSKDKGAPDHRPRLNHKGTVALPEKSLRGALRSQAERIYRSLRGRDDAIDADLSIAESAEIGKLDTPAKLFGAPGWASPVRIRNSRCVQQPFDPATQEFLAIDRFTGGGADRLKFNAEYVYKPVFEADIEVDEARAGDTGMGLLCYVLRDLQEGDITLGYGAAKGYGACRAEIDFPDRERYGEWVKAFLRTFEETREEAGNV